MLYEGRQIYFGDVNAAKGFFVGMGFECRPRQTTGDFLTSLTNPAERLVRPGFEGTTPRTPDEFAAIWQKSQDRARLLEQIDTFNAQYPIGGPSLTEFKESRKASQARSQYLFNPVSQVSLIYRVLTSDRRAQSPYTLSVPMQVKLCMGRGYQRLLGAMDVTITSVIFNAILALVIGSVFYNLPNNTATLYSKGALIFFAVLLAAFASALEVCSCCPFREGPYD